MIKNFSMQSFSPWKFHNPTDIRFGEGSLEAVAQDFAWEKILLVTTPGMIARGTAARIMSLWDKAEWAVSDKALPNPGLGRLDALAGEWRGHNIGGIVALGGGSAIDTAKVLGILLGASPHFTLKRHFLEALPLESSPSVPVVAIPTTSGTGSEVTPFATVWDLEQGKKYSLASPLMFPRAAALDPALTHDLPWDVTVATGLDALCQAMESVWNRHASLITLDMAIRGAGEAWAVLREGRAVLDSSALRSRLMGASLLAGLAISQTRTALCHSISYPITAKFGVAHGVACGFVMPAVLRFNLSADDGRLKRLAGALGFSTARELADGLENMLCQLGVPEVLKRHGGALPALDAMASEMIAPGRSDNNLRPATSSDVRAMLAEYLPGFLARSGPAAVQKQGNINPYL